MNITWTASGVAPRAAVLLVLLACLLGVAPAAATPADPDATQDPGPEEPSLGGVVSVELTDIRPAILQAGDDLVVRGTVTNGTTVAVAEPELRLRAQQTTPISRSLLERWLDPTSRSATVLLDAQRLEDPLAPGQSASFSFTVPAEELPLSATYVAWGPRGIEVTAHDATAVPVTDPPAARSFLLWWPGIEIETMPLSVLAAATPTADERTAAREASLPAGATAADRLVPLIEALDHPGVDLAVDPSVLTHLPPAVDLTGTQEDAPSTADEATDTLQEALGDFAANRDRNLHHLPWADADAAALAHAGRGDLLSAALLTPDEAAEALGQPTSTTVLGWPAARTVDAVTVDALADAGAQTLVLPGTGLAAATQLTYTPSARVDLDLAGGEVPAAVVDDRLSALLTGTVLPVNGTGPTIELDPLTARQYLLAETAVITRERPADRRDLLLTVPRDTTAPPELLDAQLSALDEAPWLERVGLAEMFRHDAPDLARESLPELVVEDGEVDVATLERVDGVLARTAAFAGILAQPRELVEEVRSSLREVASAAWRTEPDAREEIVARAEQAASERQGLVAARPGSTLNLINEAAHIPVAVTNEMSQAAHVRVRLDPRDARLVADETVELQIPAHQSSTAQIPVHAVGSGDVVVEVLLTTPEGSPIDDPVEIQVRVRADWETVGTAVIAGILVVMLVVGIIRTVRRARRRGQPEEANT